MKILLVEDNKKTATLVQKRLAAEGFEIQLLHEGSAALPLIEKENFDLLLLDIMLPGMDGLSIVKSLRQAGQTTPVLLLSARGEVQGAAQLFAAPRLALLAREQQQGLQVRDRADAAADERLRRFRHVGDGCHPRSGV